MSKMMVNFMILFGLLSTAASAESAFDIVGTWSTKSRNVITGPGFYDPVNEQFFEPKLTGYSYSFSSDGYYEEALYRALANPSDPHCPKGIMQWQHGSFEIGNDGTLTLNPIRVDGRQLFSDPCSKSGRATYTRYNQTETFRSVNVYKDPYHEVKRLDLKSFDGSPMHPMYLVYQPPKMLPTSTLNPVVTETAMARRSFVKQSGPRSSTRTFVKQKGMINYDHFRLLGLILSSVGGVGLFLF